MKIAVTTAAVIWILITARNVLQPVAVALLVWLVLSATAQRITSLLPRWWRRGKTVARLTAACGILFFLLVLGLFVGDNIAEIRANLSVYEANLDNWLALVAGRFGILEEVRTADLLSRIEIRSVALNVAGSTASYLSALLVVLIYVVFIFVEVEAVDAKIAAYAGTPERETRIRLFLGTVKRGIDDFLSVQVLIGFLQAVPTYLLLALLGVDAALLWAVLVFMFSFIPTIGTLFGIGGPTLMTLLQFSSLGPVLTVFIVLGIVQVVCSNVLMPQLMSRSLNLSPVVVLFAVFAGGAVWGIAGALMAVPVLTIVAIICSLRPSLKGLAIAMSANGELPPNPWTAEVPADPAAPGAPQ